MEKNNNRVYFLNGESVAQIACKYQRSYFDEMSSINKQIRGYSVTCNEITRFFMDWKNYPQFANKITQTVSQIDSTLSINYPFFFKDSWNFGLCTNEYESGLPHTLGNVIVLPERVFSLDNQLFLNLLIHERVHVLQKMYSSVFHSLYRGWGFQKIDKSSVNHIFLEYSRSNPDTPDWWMIRDKIPIVLFHNQARALTDVTYEFITFQENGAMIDRIEQRDVKWYVDLIGNKPHCYHPDETAAVLLADYFLSEKPQTAPSHFEHILDRWIKMVVAKIY